MLRPHWMSLLVLPVLTVAALAVPVASAEATTCADGSYSSSTGSGTCSWHGGIAGGDDYGSTYGDEYDYGDDDSGSSEYYAPQTLCADGTYSSSTGSGTCSWHGGIAGGTQPTHSSDGFSGGDSQVRVPQPLPATSLDDSGGGGSTALFLLFMLAAFLLFTPTGWVLLWTVKEGLTTAPREGRPRPAAGAPEDRRVAGDPTPDRTRVSREERLWWQSPDWAAVNGRISTHPAGERVRDLAQRAMTSWKQETAGGTVPLASHFGHEAAVFLDAVVRHAIVDALLVLPVPGGTDEGLRSAVSASVHSLERRYLLLAPHLAAADGYRRLFLHLAEHTAPRA